MNEINNDMNRRAFPQQGNSLKLDKADLDYLAGSISEIVVGCLSRNVGGPRTTGGNSKFERDVLEYLNAIYRGVTVTDAHTGKQQYAHNSMMRNQEKLSSELNGITDEIRSIHSIMESNEKVMEEQASIIKKQHDTISRYESDVIYKTQKDLIMELIGIADQLSYVIQDASSESCTRESLLQSVRDLKDWVDGSLQAVAVRPYRAHESRNLDVKRQEIVEVLPTAEIREDGMLRSIVPGYIWSVPLVGSNVMLQNDGEPKMYEFMIRPEQVARLKYEAPASFSALSSEEQLIDENSDDELLEEKKNKGFFSFMSGSKK